jgi:hypothetical protein
LVKAPGASSDATRIPKPWGPDSPVSLAAKAGLTTARVWRAFRGVWKVSRPSRKKGRFSGKKMGKRSLAVTTIWSASTWAKSGLKVTSAVTVGVKPMRAVTPGCALTASWTKRGAVPGGTKTGRRPRSETMRLGITSIVRLREISSIPVMSPAWLKVPDRSRAMGIQELSSSL